MFKIKLRPLLLVILLGVISTSQGEPQKRIEKKPASVPVQAQPAETPQEKALPAPAIPLMPDVGQWTITFDYQNYKPKKSIEGESAEEAAQPVDDTTQTEVYEVEYDDDERIGLMARVNKILYIRTEGLNKLDMTFNNGEKFDAYSYQGQMVSFHREYKEKMVFGISGVMEVDVFAEKKTYPGFEMILPEDYLGVKEAYGQMCHYFKSDDHLARLAKLDETYRYRVCEVWVSVESGLPVAIRRDGEEGIFRFNLSQPKPVKFPKKYVETWTKIFKKPPPVGV